MNQFKKSDPDQKWKALIRELFQEHKGRYGYRRIHSELRKRGYVINHKKSSEAYESIRVDVCKVYT